MTEIRHKKTICFDFDGVCSTYGGWKGFNVFGKPVPQIALLVNTLQQRGYNCILWTTRLHTPELDQWLRTNGFSFDSINSCCHNPPNTNNKPIADMYIDDRAFRFSIKHAVEDTKKISDMLDGSQKSTRNKEL